MHCGCRCASARWATGQRGLSEQRTTSELVMKTTQHALCLGRTEPGPRWRYTSDCRNRSGRGTGHLWCMCRVFTPEGIRRGTAAGLPRGPDQRKISNLHLRTSLPTGLYASLRPKGSASLREGLVLACCRHRRLYKV